MKKRIISIFLAIIMIPCFTVTSKAQGVPSVSAESAILIDAYSKDVLFEKDPCRRMPMASTTKIMTALVVLEKLSTDHCFTVSDSAIGTEGTSAYLKKSDRLSVEDALYALLLQSANDVAVALAIETAGSIESFCVLMNKKAEELGLLDTRFANPSGLPCEDHYTTAKDLAILASECLENDVFSKIVSTKKATVNISDEERTFVNHNKLLSLYSGAIGVKTGYTRESGRCLVGAASRNGVTLISVTLSASDDWKDHTAMLDYGFLQYRSYTLYSPKEFVISFPVAGYPKDIEASPDGSMSVSLPKGKKISVIIESSSLITAPVKKGDTIATAVFCADGKELARAFLKVISDGN